jgi:hypothetical protein
MGLSERAEELGRYFYNRAATAAQIARNRAYGDNSYAVAEGAPDVRNEDADKLSQLADLVMEIVARLEPVQ